MVDMNVFLAVDENGVKLATKSPFWKEATEAMWAVPTKEIRAVMTAAGWTQAEKNRAQTARYNQTLEGKAKFAARNNSPKGRAAQAKYDNSPNGKAVRSAYGNSPEGRAKRAAYRQTPEGKAKRAAYRNSPKGRAKRAAYNQTPKAKATRATWGKSPKAKETRLAWHLERMATDPQYATLHNSRRQFHIIYKSAKKSGLYTPAQLANLDKRTHELLGCSSKELMEHFEKQFKPGMTHFNRGKYNRNDHMTNPTWQDDHAFPTAIMFKNKHILGLEEFVIGYKNHTPCDAFFNKLKNDHIILECISPDCPGYPFTDGLIGVEIIFKTVDEFLLFKGYINRDEFPFLK
jgi:hypothetical protein